MALRMFVTEDEWAALFRELAQKRGLAACIQRGNEFFPFDPQLDPSPLRSPDEIHPLGYLALSSDLEGLPEQSERARPKDWGWIQIQGGGIRTVQGASILTQTTFDASNGIPPHLKGTTILASFRRSLRTRFSFGIRGTNVKFGGSGDYGDMAYSRKALELWNQGCLWKYEEKDNVVYEPISQVGKHT